MPLEGAYEPSPQQWVRDQVTVQDAECQEKTDRRIPVFLVERPSS